MTERDCLCGCGAKTKGGKFCPGNDQKLRKAIEYAVGGLESLRSITEGHLGKPISTRPAECSGPLVAVDPPSVKLRRGPSKETTAAAPQAWSQQNDTSRTNHPLAT